MNTQPEIAIVTGGGTGLGLAIGRSLEARGITVVRAGLQENSAAGNWRMVDVRDQDQVIHLVKSVVDQFGRLDIMVNNAGIAAPEGSSIELNRKYWHDIVDTNLNGTWFGCRAAIQQMLLQEKGGRIVNISSRLAFSAGGPGRAAYGASKAAVSNLTRQLAVEYGKRGVRVNAVCPGFVPDTALTGGGDVRIQLAKEQTPSTRLGRSEDVAAAVSFLVSEAAGFINGHNLVVDGGASVRS